MSEPDYLVKVPRKLYTHPQYIEASNIEEKLESLRNENEKLRRMNIDQAAALQVANDECRRLLDKLHPPKPQKRTCETCQHKGTLLCNSCGGADLCFRMWEPRTAGERIKCEHKVIREIHSTDPEIEIHECQKCGQIWAGEVAQ